MKVKKHKPFNLEVDGNGVIKIYECKLCDFTGIRKEVRKHIRENHFWRGEELPKKIKSNKFI